jgi:hypothetical protein
MPWACLVEVEAHDDRVELDGLPRNAHLKVYLRDAERADLYVRIEEALEEMGFHLRDFRSAEPVGEVAIPPEARKLYEILGVGFGTLHSFPPGDASPPADSAG